MPTTRLNGRALDVRPDRIDLRDYTYRPPLVSLPDEWPPTDWVRDYLPAYCKGDMVLNQGSDAAPIFCICGVYLYHDLAGEMPNRHPVYGMFIPADDAVPDIQALARRYLAAIQRVL